MGDTEAVGKLAVERSVCPRVTNPPPPPPTRESSGVLYEYCTVCGRSTDRKKLSKLCVEVKP